MRNRRSAIDSYRGLLRRLHFAKGRSSYPYISGDTYASLCSSIYKPGSNFFSRQDNEEDISIFLPAYLKDDFLDDVLNVNFSLQNQKLVIHNYDNIPSEKELLFLSQKFAQVYCVNWLGSREIALPIPIGLENWSHLRNGVPRDFRKMRKLINQSFEARPVELLSSFSPSTNLSERSKALKFSQSYSKAYQMPEFTTPAKYRELVASSKFVLSPPGNGPDCHRTWEALYLGAVPIVLRKSWPFEYLDLPILIVEDWEEVPEKIRQFTFTKGVSVEELRKLFLEF